MDDSNQQRRFLMERREFLQTTFLAAGAAVLAGPTGLKAAGGVFPAGVIYTSDNPGKWAGKEGGHAPKVTVEGSKASIVTPHPMTEKHFIVRHTLVTTDGKVLGEKTFVPTDGKAASSFELPAGQSGKLYATSFCNLHDFWLTEFSI
jgi:superoxide reductase